MIPLRGEIWLIKLDPTKGSEIRKTRPCLVLSNDHHNAVNRILMVIPMTTTKMRYPSNQILLDPTTGIHHESCLEIPQMRSADRSRLVKKVGSISSEKLREIFFKLNFHLGFSSFLKGIDLH